MLFKATISKGASVGAEEGDSMLFNSDSIAVVHAYGDGAGFSLHVSSQSKTRILWVAVDETPLALSAYFNDTLAYPILTVDVFPYEDNTQTATTEYIPFRDIIYLSEYSSTQSWMMLRRHGGVKRVLIDASLDEVLEDALEAAKVALSEDGSPELNENGSHLINE